MVLGVRVRLGVLVVARVDVRAGDVAAHDGDVAGGLIMGNLGVGAKQREPEERNPCC